MNPLHEHRLQLTRREFLGRSGTGLGLAALAGLLAGEGHIPLSCTPEPASAAPVSGAVDPCESTMRHEMRVTRIFESPRVTKPYTDEQWERIEVLGHRVDEELRAGDVRLTMGGEPTFVSIDDMEVHRFVHAGETMSLVADLTSIRFGIATGRCRGLIGGELVTEASMVVAIPEILNKMSPVGRK